MINTEEMRKLEDNCGISKLQLMENAGKGVYNILKERFKLKEKSILVAAYHGNNGGDGFVAARHLSQEAETDVLFLGDENNLREEGRINLKRIEENNKIQILVELEQVDFDDYDIIIDALLGTGTSGDIKEPIASAIKLINESSAFKASIDIPSGMNPDTGEGAETAVNPDLIITFHDIKQGMEKYKEKIAVVDIGINGPADKKGGEDGV